MRLAVVIVLLSATAAAAQTPPQGDRYGPRQSPAPQAPGTAAASATYNGPMLGWARKTTPVTQAQQARSAPPRRLASGLYAGSVSAAVQAVRAAPAPSPIPRPTQAALPDSLYARPTAPAAAPQAAMTAPPAPPTRQTAYATPSRFYSVYREYGGQPDAIPPPPPGGSWAYRPEASLIEPFDPPKKKKKEDGRTAAETDGDWGASSDGLLGGSDE